MLAVLGVLLAPEPIPPAVPEPLAVKEIVVEWTPENIRALAYEKARKYDLASLGLEEAYVRTMDYESKGFIDPCIQSEVPSPDGPNGQENSWGVSQFWLTHPMETPDGRLITKEIACDPEQALDASAWHFSQGRAHRWNGFGK